MRHHPLPVTLLRKSNVLQPNGAFPSSAVVVEQIQWDLGSLIFVGEVVDGLCRPVSEAP